MNIKIRKKKLKNGDVSLYLDIYHNGIRKYEFLNIRLTKNKQLNKQSLELAESIRAKRQIEIQNSDHGFIPQFKKKANYVAYFEKLSNTKAQEKSWLSVLKLLKEYTGGSIQFSAVNNEWLEQFKIFLLTKVSINSVNVYFGKIKTSLKQAYKEKIIIYNPENLVQNVKREDTERVFLTEQELQKIASTPCENSEIKRAFLFACFTGLRFSDICKIKWLNIQGDNLYFKQKKTGGQEYLPLSKTAKRILNTDTKNIIHHPEQNIFTTYTNVYTNIILNTWRLKAGIDKKITFHTARHTFATMSISHGVDLYTVSKLLGHKSIANTQIYAKIIDSKKQEAVDLLPKIEVGS